MKKVSIRVTYQGEQFNPSELSNAFHWLETQMDAVDLDQCDQLSANVGISESTYIEFLMTTEAEPSSPPVAPGA